MQYRFLSSPVADFNLFGWSPCSELSDDENYMDIVFLITRSSKNGQQGHMGSLIVRPTISASRGGGGEIHEIETECDYKQRIFSNILGAATNTPLFGTKEITSDIHAEISALGQACQASHSTTGCTAYITIPPCKRCFAALVAFGIRRIVTRQESPKEIRETAARQGMEVLSMTREQNRAQMKRINDLVNPHLTDEALMQIAEKKREQRMERKLAKTNMHNAS